MSALERRLVKLERVHGGGVQERLFVFITALGPGPHELIGLSPCSSSGKLLPRLAGESVDALQARAVRQHPGVPVWVSRYEEGENQTSKLNFDLPP